jgi:hypothetical protein
MRVQTLHDLTTLLSTLTNACSSFLYIYSPIPAVSSHYRLVRFCDARSCCVISSRDIFLFSMESSCLESNGPGNCSVCANARRFASEPQFSFESLLNVIQLECDLREADFHFDLGNSQHLKVLLLSQSSVQDNSQETIAQLKRFSCMAPGSHRKAIVFLLTEEPFSSASSRYSLEGLLALQVLYASSSLLSCV